jgi:hypothetical protein
MHGTGTRARHRAQRWVINVTRSLGLGDIVENFTLIGDELELLRNIYTSCPRTPSPISPVRRRPASSHVSISLVAPPSATAQRSAHTQAFRECSVTDAALAAWLTEHVGRVERREDRVREQLLALPRASPSAARAVSHPAPSRQ